MKGILRKLGVSLIALIVVSGMLLGASEFKPGKGKGKGHGHNGAPISTPEPSSIALLGAGLVSLGLYAKRKNANK